jgi:hypothetical protein
MVGGRYETSGRTKYMTAVSSVSINDTNQALSAKASEASTTETQESSAFAKVLQGLLVPSGEGNVSEEALFAALTMERVKSMKGDEAGAKYEALLKRIQGEMTTANGYIPYEDAARSALNEFQLAGELTGDEANQIHSQAFGAAQLDSNTDALYDHIGNTAAVGQMASVLASAKALIDKYVAGTETATSRPIASGLNTSGRLINPYESGSVTKSTGAATGASNTANGTYFDGPEGFLFKPVSANNGKLAIMLPAEISREVVECLLKDSEGNVVENGTHWAPGFAAEGDPAKARKKYSFNKPGAQYPDNLTVEVRLADGSVRSYEIPDPAKRYD